MVVDSSMYCGESDILTLRLETLWDCVDKFVIVESSKSHVGKPKPLYFKEDQDKFKKYSQKIIHLMADLDLNPNPFIVNWQYRDFLMEVICPNLISTDTFIHGDLDEIPKPELVKNYLNNPSGISFFQNDLYHYALDLRHPKPNMWERGSFIGQFKFLKESFSQTREHWHAGYTLIPNGGWHYSYCMPPADILKKLDYFAHSSEFTPEMKTLDYVKERIKAMESLHAAPARMKFEQIDINLSNSPKYLVDNLDKFSYLLYNNIIK